MFEPVIILVRPQMGENIGATARAMLNFSLQDLRLVAPRDGWPNAAAVSNSSGALDVMAEPQVFEDLPRALADCHYVYATTARSRDMVKPVMDVSAAMEDARKRQADGQKIAFVFGPERTGLENDDLAHCHGLIHVPTNPDFSSLNLAQCALLIVYEWAMSEALEPSDIVEYLPAEQGEIDNFFNRLEEELESAGFFRDEGLKPTMQRNIRNMFLRAELTDQEIRTFHGIVSALIGNKKAAQ